jgi:uncharacterized protein
MNGSLLPVITTLYASILGLMAALLTIQVIIKRVRLRVESGDGGKPAMAQAIRAHGNFTENVPFTLLLLACVESIGGVPFTIHILGILLIIARCLSALGLSQSLNPSLPRQAGASITILVMIMTSFYGLTLSKDLFMRVLHL